MNDIFSGSGPGIQTPDGCSVELYRALPYMREFDEVASFLRNGGSALELGCGAGRLAAELQRLGFRVTGVDQSSEMLALLPAGVQPVQSDIEALALDSTFDLVLLASHLINHPNHKSRREFVECARRHLEPRGRLLLQRHNPEWLRTAVPGPVGRAGPIAVHVESVSRHAAAVAMKLRYESEGGTWYQSFEALPLSEQEVEAALAQVGFGRVSWHGSARVWASAVAL